LRIDDRVCDRSSMAPPLPILQGRRFGCTRCARCCIEPGYVFMSFEEMRGMATHLGLSLSVFKSRFSITWDADSHKWVIDAHPNGCPLLTAEGACSVHPVKPMQCQTFPFWPELLADQAAWDESKKYCPGMDAEGGRLYTIDEIRAIRDEQRGT
jgi:uncharacterized protein